MFGLNPDREFYKFYLGMDGDNFYEEIKIFLVSPRKFLYKSHITA